jgi:hypothetical protein
MMRRRIPASAMRLIRPRMFGNNKERQWPWNSIAAGRKSLTNCFNRRRQAKDKMGLLGFSLGGHLALRRAKMGGGVRVKAAVEFFAPITMPPFHGLGGDIDKLPPTQIHHGNADELVPPEESDKLKQSLLKAGKLEGRDFEVHIYPGEGHGFKGAAAVTSSRQRTGDFFDNTSCKAAVRRRAGCGGHWQGSYSGFSSSRAVALVRPRSGRSVQSTLTRAASRPCCVRKCRDP